MTGDANGEPAGAGAENRLAVGKRRDSIASSEFCHGHSVFRFQASYLPRICPRAASHLRTKVAAQFRRAASTSNVMSIIIIVVVVIVVRPIFLHSQTEPYGWAMIDIVVIIIFVVGP